MKLTRVEQLFDGSRLIFYYTAEGRVDFRELVRDLAGHFRTRIEMRQIGVRDEARMLGGYGSCGRPLCCTTWLQTFEPVSIKMAKQQRLSLNPSKLSGMCGRLKCCLRYELPNAKGVVHGGCGDEGGCGPAPTPPGRAAGRGGVRIRRLREVRVASEMSKPPRLASPSAIPPASARRSPSRRPVIPDVLAVCEPVLYGPSRRRSWRRSIAGSVSANAGQTAYEAILARGRRRAGGPHRRRGDGTDQQGSVRRGRNPVAGAHRAARASHRHLAIRDDVLRRRAAGGPRDRAHRAVGGAARAHGGAARRDDRAHGRRAAALRPSAAEACGRRPEPARRRARRHRQGRGRGDAAGDRRVPRARHRRRRPVSGRHHLPPRDAGASSTR